MKKDLVSITTGAFLTAIPLFLLALAYPKLFALFGLLLVTACVIVGLSLIAAIPRGLELAFNGIRKSEDLRKEVAKCKYCGYALPTDANHCPNCGAPEGKEDARFS